MAPSGTRYCSDACQVDAKGPAKPAPMREDRVPVVNPNLRPDRILPSRLAMVSGEVAARDAGRRSGRLFSVARHIVQSGKDQLVLPGFSIPAVEGPCLPLALYDLGVGRNQKHSPAAPLALRIFIEACLEVPMDHRGGRRRLPVPFREFLARLWPHELPRPVARFRHLNQAAAALDSDDARIPWEGTDGKGGLWRVVSVINIPRGPDHLDDEIIIDVELPPGSGPGPMVSPNLHLYGTNAVGYRALLNLAYRWYDPGKTRIPSNRSKRHWIQNPDPRAYPGVTERDLLAICYPASADIRGGTKRQYVLRARRMVEKLAAAGELRIVQGHILPPKE